MRVILLMEVVVKSRPDAFRNFDFISSLLCESVSSIQNVSVCLNIYLKERCKTFKMMTVIN
jgi:hypothetical protein